MNQYIKHVKAIRYLKIVDKIVVIIVIVEGAVDLDLMKKKVV
jgi:hypothetical protein